MKTAREQMLMENLKGKMLCYSWITLGFQLNDSVSLKVYRVECDGDVDKFYDRSSRKMIFLCEEDTNQMLKTGRATVKGYNDDVELFRFYDI